MGTQILSVVMVLLFVHHAARGALFNQEDSKCSCDEEVINRKGFPKGFVFGSASAAYQIEGAYKAKGKGPSMWDNFTHTYPDKIRDHSNGDVAIDSYNLYKEDVKLLKNMGADAYKFSISWSRILPGGTLSEGVSQEGISYYNNLINELLANGIEPWITLLLGVANGSPGSDPDRILTDWISNGSDPKWIQQYGSYMDPIRLKNFHI